MARNIMKRVERVVGLLAFVAMLAVTTDPLQVSAQTLTEPLDADFLGDLRFVRWFAEQGLASAQTRLGVMYANGEGVPEDDAEAVRWYRLAAEQGDARAQAILGGKYAIGEGVPEDAGEAYAWLSILVAQGDTSARELKDIIAGRMTMAQIAEAQKRSRKYWERYVLPFR